MKIRALSALLLLGGTVSFASATPEKTETTERVSYSDKTRRAAPQKDDDGWLELATPTPASHGREYIIVDAGLAPIIQLRLTAAAGRPIVRALTIDFRDGSRRVVRLDKTLDSKHPAYVDLREPKRIARVTVVSEGPKKATYALHGAPASGGVATR